MPRSHWGDGFRHPQAEKALARLRMPADPEALVTTGEWLEQRSGPRAPTIRGYAAGQPVAASRVAEWQRTGIRPPVAVWS